MLSMQKLSWDLTMGFFVHIVALSLNYSKLNYYLSN